MADATEWAEKNKNKAYLYCGSGFVGSNIFPENILDESFRVYTLENWFEKYFSGEGS